MTTFNDVTAAQLRNEGKLKPLTPFIYYGLPGQFDFPRQRLTLLLTSVTGDLEFEAVMLNRDGNDDRDLRKPGRETRYITIPLPTFVALLSAGVIQ